MSGIVAEETRTIGVPAVVVYEILADYHSGHPSILPAAFTDLVVDAGGRGRGTRIHFDATMMGRRDRLSAEIDEPEPGRVLVERYPDRGMVTKFMVDPVADGCRVTIRTEIAASGIRRFLQRLIVPPMLRRVFREELANLERVARERTPASSETPGLGAS